MSVDVCPYFCSFHLFKSKIFFLSPKLSFLSGLNSVFLFVFTLLVVDMGIVEWQLYAVTLCSSHRWMKSTKRLKLKKKRNWRKNTAAITFTHRNKQTVPLPLQLKCQQGKLEMSNSFRVWNRLLLIYVHSWIWQIDSWGKASNKSARQLLLYSGFLNYDYNYLFISF